MRCVLLTGKYDIVPALARLRDENVKFRTLGLSATPGSSRESIQAWNRLPTDLDAKASLLFHRQVPETLHPTACCLEDDCTVGYAVPGCRFKAHCAAARD